ncbi:MAG: sigma-70 family RNA polymerase sigma factor, partial [Synergistaceae bacterium]|nr:sigma-70 family RNA polymerase sigma factor [Synergistaceae bacterium]
DEGHIKDELVMREMGVDEAEYFEVQELASRSYVASLDEVMELEDGDVSLEATLADDRESMLDRLVAEDDKELLMNAIKKLSEKEQQVLALYYYEGLSLKEIGRVIGVTESRVSQIHGKALSLLRAVLKEEA